MKRLIFYFSVLLMSAVSKNDDTDSNRQTKDRTAILAPPANDNVANAISLTLNSVCSTPVYSTVGSTKQANEPVLACREVNYGPGSVWFKYTATSSNPVRISTLNHGNYGTQPASSFGTLFDGSMGVYTTTDVNDFSKFKLIACFEDNFYTKMPILFLTNLEAGKDYYIQIGDGANAPAMGTFCVAVEDLNASMISNWVSTEEGGCTQYTQMFILGPERPKDYWMSLVDYQGRIQANFKPIGDATSYYASNIFLNSAGVRQDPNDNNHRYLDRQWRLETGAALSGPIQLTVFFNQTEKAALTAVDANAGSLVNYRIKQDKDATCKGPLAGTGNTLIPVDNFGSTASGDGHYLTFSTATLLNFYAEAVSGALPVNLLSFQAKVTIENSIKLDWNVSNEINMTSYFIEKSSNGKSFETIGSVDANGLKKTQSYSYTDSKPLPGNNYYRLRMTETTGKQQFSSIRNVNMNEDKKLIVFPSPAKNRLFISGSVEKDLVVEIYNTLGVMINTIKSAGNELSENGLNIESLNAGNYIVKIKNKDKIQTVQFVKY